MEGHPRNKIHLARIREEGCRVLAVGGDDSKPVLVENKVGRGICYLLTLWNYPGEEKLGSFVESILKRLAESSQGKVRIEGPDTLNYAAYTSDVGWERETEFGKVHTKIYIIDTNWWDVCERNAVCALHLVLVLTLSYGTILKFCAGETVETQPW